MKKLLTILFFPLVVFSQQRITGNPTFMRNVAPASGGGESVIYEVIEANPAAVDTAIDGLGLLVQGTRISIIGGWNASFGLPYTRNSVYGLTTVDYSTQYKVQAPWTPRHSMGYGTGGTGFGYLVGGDWQPEGTALSRREVWRTTTDTSAMTWTLQTNVAPWNDSNCLFAFTIIPDSVSGNDTLIKAGGQFNYALSYGVDPKVWESYDAGVTWTNTYSNSRFFGGNNNGCLYWFKKIRKFVCIKGAKYDNDAGTRTWADSVFLMNRDFSSPTYIGKLNPAIQYPAMCEWDNRVWIICGNTSSANTSKIYSVNSNGVFNEMVITMPTPLHATSLAVDAVNDRLIVACGNLVKNVWYIRKQAL